MAGGASTAFNLGNGQGFSVQEVIETARRVTGQEFFVSDPPRLVADPRRANALLGWQPQFSSLEQIVTHAWNWEQKHPWH